MSQSAAFRTCIEMLEQRGYEIVDSDPEELTISALKLNGEQVSVYFNNAPKFDTKSMKEVISMMEEEGIDHSIVIYKDNITAATAAVLEQTVDLKIELFAEEDLQINITKHRLQPTFCKLSADDATLFKKEYGIKFPTLRHNQPISKFYNYEKGDVIKIQRQNNTIIYRIVR
jgi:DNA-directed RNA polymerase I, II, and III subunit RPABC1